MEIIAFQVFIVLSMAFARFVSPKALSISALAWSAATLILVFATPLILIQLLVIWGTYSLFAPKEAPPKVAARSNTDRHPSDKSRSASVSKVTQKVASSRTVGQGNPDISEDGSKEPDTGAFQTDTIRQLLRKLEKVNANLDKMKLISEITQKVERQVFDEKIAIESALEIAEFQEVRRKHVEGLDDKSRKIYENSHKLAKQLLSSDKKESAYSLEITSVPDFKSVPNHDIPEVAAAVKAKYASLAQERSQRLNALFCKLEREPRIQEAFWAELGAESKALLLGSLDRKPSERLSESQPLATRLFGTQNNVVSDLRNCASLGERVAARQIPYLVHFTRVENIPSIMKAGLLSVRDLREAAATFVANDQGRWDGHAAASCLSIAHPNEKLFYRWRKQNPETAWVVLVLTPDIMTALPVAFCPHNAADARMRKKDIKTLQSVAAFDEMFAEHETTPHRDLQGLSSFDPSDVQAEVLVFEKIPPTNIVGAAFCDSVALQKYGGQFGSRPVRHVPDGEGFFGSRERARFAGWQF